MSGGRRDWFEEDEETSFHERSKGGEACLERNNREEPSNLKRTRDISLPGRLLLRVLSSGPSQVVSAKALFCNDSIETTQTKSPPSVFYSTGRTLTPFAVGEELVSCCTEQLKMRVVVMVNRSLHFHETV